MALGMLMAGANLCAAATPSTEMYVDLMKRILANTIYEDAAFQGAYNLDQRLGGLDWPLVAHTMVGMKRLDNLHACLKEVIEEQIPGDCIETGVWRGGCTILMKAILKAYGETERKVWVADSFTGFPKVDLAKYPADRSWVYFNDSFLKVSMQEVQRNFQKYGLLDDQVIFVPGFFANTLPTLPIQQIAVLRLDGDLYESTMESLTYLYPKLSVGGFVIIDDYSIESCRKAVADYRQSEGITEEILPIDGVGVYWKKTTF